MTASPRLNPRRKHNLRLRDQRTKYSTPLLSPQRRHPPQRHSTTLTFDQFQILTSLEGALRRHALSSPVAIRSPHFPPAPPRPRSLVRRARGCGRRTRGRAAPPTASSAPALPPRASYAPCASGSPSPAPGASRWSCLCVPPPEPRPPRAPLAAQPRRSPRPRRAASSLAAAPRRPRPCGSAASRAPPAAARAPPARVSPPGMLPSWLCTPSRGWRGPTGSSPLRASPLSASLSPRPSPPRDRR
mmetsp:Transcript_7157/g.17231  ORF Transcript_7157/g.17231 Transcript_7157/m.17231 type:complete len:244 (+) Transcript_7157:22-753(+)